ncbi:hypothetical protein PanWU01x14_102330, partial [Parasponia andersonii]
SICTDVRANKLHTSSSTIRLARLFEARDISFHRNYQFPSRATPLPHQNPGIVPIKRMNIEKPNEERDDSDEDIVIKEDGNSEAQIHERPEISLHAIVGIRAPRTTWIHGHLSDQQVMVLMYSGSAHNVINEHLA